MKRANKPFHATRESTHVNGGVMPESDEAEKFLARHRESKAIERSSAGKIIRKVSRGLKSRGFSRRSTFFSREKDHIIQFVHIHKYSFGRCFRVHVGLRVLNDPKQRIALNGISSNEHPHYRTSIIFGATDDSLDACAKEVLAYVTGVAEPWFDQQTGRALLSKGSPLYPDERVALAAALRGESDEGNVLLSKSLF